jgi:hypothetical protein
VILIPAISETSIVTVFEVVLYVVVPSEKVPVAVFLIEVPAAVPSAKAGASEKKALAAARLTASKWR